jgi:type IX secretion system PorP/SprF family membrane protein
MRRTLFLLVIFLSTWSSSVFAQDPQFSQFYAAPLYLNPAFAGSTELARVGVNYRNQWPAMTANFVTYSAYFDYFFEDYNSGVGLLLLSDREGLAGFVTNSVALQYSYQFRLFENLVVRPGLQASYNMRRMDFGNLVFGDQINFNGQFKPVTDDVFLGEANNNYLDIGTGVLVYSNRFWLGFAAHHLLEPNQTLIDEDSPLPRKYSVHAGYKIPLPTKTDLGFPGGYRDVSFTPTMQYKLQGEFSQMDLGLYFNYEPIVLGTWYRGVPFKPVEGFGNNESIVMLVGYSSNGLHVGYSYDYTISNLAVRNTGGAHEISLRYEFFLGDPRRPPKNVRRIPCPRF